MKFAFSNMAYWRALKGFTLLEAMLVAAIIGLASLTVVNDEERDASEVYTDKAVEYIQLYIEAAQGTCNDNIRPYVEDSYNDYHDPQTYGGLSNWGEYLGGAAAPAGCWGNVIRRVNNNRTDTTDNRFAPITLNRLMRQGQLGEYWQTDSFNHLRPNMFSSWQEFRFRMQRFFHNGQEPTLATGNAFWITQHRNGAGGTSHPIVALHVADEMRFEVRPRLEIRATFRNITTAFKVANKLANARVVQASSGDYQVLVYVISGAQFMNRAYYAHRDAPKNGRTVSLNQARGRVYSNKFLADKYAYLCNNYLANNPQKQCLPYRRQTNSGGVRHQLSPNLAVNARNLLRAYDEADKLVSLTFDQTKPIAAGTPRYGIHSATSARNSLNRTQRTANHSTPNLYCTILGDNGFTGSDVQPCVADVNPPYYIGGVLKGWSVDRFAGATTAAKRTNRATFLQDYIDNHTDIGPAIETLMISLADYLNPTSATVAPRSYMQVGIWSQANTRQRYLYMPQAIRNNQAGLAVAQDLTVAGLRNASGTLLNHDPTNPSSSHYTLYGGEMIVNGAFGATSYGRSSDTRLKKEIRHIEQEEIDSLYEIQPAVYSWKDDAEYTRYIGFIAQDIQRHLPELVYGSEETKLSVDYESMLPLILASHKDMESRLNKLDDRSRSSIR